MDDPQKAWTLITALAGGAMLLRISLSGMLMRWALSALGMRVLPLLAIPGVVAPSLIWPGAAAGQGDDARVVLAVGVMLVAALFRRAIVAMVLGAGVLYGLPQLAG